MPVKINLRHLEKIETLELQGALEPSELGLEQVDELIEVNEPLRYAVEVSRAGHHLVVKGKLELELDCRCARCLELFKYEVCLEQWVVDVPLEGEEQVKVENDLVDLTPFIREDILLAFPQHPLCHDECRGIPYEPHTQQPSESAVGQEGRSAWDELDKLKL